MLFHFFRLMFRFRYPVCCPKDLSQALGVSLPNCLSFQQLIEVLSHGGYRVASLEKFMLRDKAEATFSNAQRIERFPSNTLVSYYFNEGWLEFNLHFDDHGRLRRLYLNHQDIAQLQGIEIALRSTPADTPSSIGSGKHIF